MSLFNFSHPPINLLTNFDEELLNFYRNVILKTKFEKVNMVEEVNTSKTMSMGGKVNKSKNISVVKEVNTSKKIDMVKEVKTNKIMNKIEEVNMSKMMSRVQEVNKRKNMSMVEVNKSMVEEVNKNKKTSMAEEVNMSKKENTFEKVDMNLSKKRSKSKKVKSKKANMDDVLKISKMKSTGKKGTKKTKKAVKVKNNVHKLPNQSPGYSSAIANHLLRMVNKHPMIFQDALWKRCVNICCLGGGEAYEVLAISKLMSSAQDWFWLSTRKPLHMNVTIVDKDQKCVETIEKMLETLKEATCIFDTMKMTISIKYLITDISKTLNEDIKQALIEADIVTLVNFFSVFEISEDYSGFPNLIQDISTNMKTNAVLFYLDTGINMQSKMLHYLPGIFDNLRRIYGPIELEAFTPDLKAIRKCSKLKWHLLRSDIRFSGCIIDSCAWIKIDSVTINGINTHGDNLQVRNVSSVSVQFFKRMKGNREQKAAVSRRVLKKFNIAVGKILSKKYPKRDENEDEIAVEEDLIIEENLMTSKSKQLFQTESKSRRIWLTGKPKYACYF